MMKAKTPTTSRSSMAEGGLGLPYAPQDVSLELVHAKQLGRGDVLIEKLGGRTEGVSSDALCEVTNRGTTIDILTPLMLDERRRANGGRELVLNGASGSIERSALDELDPGVG